LDILESIKNRRSIRKFKIDPIDDKTIETILDAARLAPSWTNTQCWRFIVVRDSNIKSQLADTLQRPSPNVAANPATNAIKNAPVVIVACAEKGISGCYEGKPSTDKGDYWFMYDIALAMQNLTLTATSLGLGTVHVGLFDNTKVSALLDVPDKFTVVAMTPLGVPEYQPNPRPRKELGEIVFKEKFGQK
jgi:nitroreductase